MQGYEFLVAGSPGSSLANAVVIQEALYRWIEVHVRWYVVLHFFQLF